MANWKLQTKYAAWVKDQTCNKRKKVIKKKQRRRKNKKRVKKVKKVKKTKKDSKIIQAINIQNKEKAVMLKQNETLVIKDSVFINKTEENK